MMIFAPNSLIRRYADNTFLLFRSQIHITLFFDYLNAKHDRLNYTLETETNAFSTSTYRKPTFTGLVQNFLVP